MVGLWVIFLYIILPKFSYIASLINLCLTSYKKFYSAIKKNEIMLFPTTWVDLETVILSEVSQTEKRHAV